MNALDEGAAALRISRTFAGATATLDTARRLVADVLLDQAVPAEPVERARLVVSELASNAIEFAPGADYTVTLERATSATAVSITVRSRAVRTDVPGEGTMATDEPGDLVLRGRGLAIVRTLSESVTVSENRDGTIDITATLSVT